MKQQVQLQQFKIIKLQSCVSTSSDTFIDVSQINNLRKYSNVFSSQLYPSSKGINQEPMVTALKDSIIEDRTSVHHTKHTSQTSEQSQLFESVKNKHYIACNIY